MKKFFTLLVAMVAFVAAQAWTVSFTNPDGWTNVNVYTFNAETCGGWPGKAMTKVGDVWTYEGTGTPGKIIFNNGSGQQTGNLDFVDGGTYDKNGVVGAKLNTYTVYFNNSTANWSNVYLYTFGPEANGGWPGKELSKNADGLYVWTYEATSEPDFGGIIFNNGGNGSQSGNLKFKDGQVYDQNGEYVEGPKTFPENMYVIGNVNGEGWNPLNGFAMVNEGEGVYTVAGIEIGNEQLGGTGYFAFASTLGENDGDWTTLNANRYGATSKDLEVVFETAMTVQKGENSWSVAPGTYDFVLNMDKMTLTVTEAVVEDELPETPSDEQLVDAVTLPTGLNATVVESPDFDGVAITGKSTEDTVILTFTAPEGYDTVYIANLYGDGGVSPLRKLGSGAEWLPASMATSMGAVKTNEVSVEADGEDHEFAVIYGLGDMINADYIWYRANITKDTVSGVEIVAADADATYFNLQGARVANPTNGIYVKVVNGKAVKVVR